MKRNSILKQLSVTGTVLLLAGELSLSASAASKFDPAYYAAAYPDVTEAVGTDSQALLTHYLDFGMAEGRIPYQGAAPGAKVDSGASPKFDPAYYAAAYPDVTEAVGTDPQVLLAHYLSFGMTEGRIPCQGAAPGTKVDDGTASQNPAPANSKTASQESAQTGGAKFDPAFYAWTYPDVVRTLGADPQTLLAHYVHSGMAEGRLPYYKAAPGTAVTGMAEDAPIATMTGVPVPVKKLANLKSLKKKQTDAELAKTYDAAWALVAPLAGLSREEQLQGIAIYLRQIFDSGITYTTDMPHYNDPYGYLVLGVASCAGCARATGLCLNILGIPYEHVNENQWSHQWCRVNIDGTYWICDAFGLYCGPEPAPYQHPYLD